jgi:L-asparaginase II
MGIHFICRISFACRREHSLSNPVLVYAHRGDAVESQHAGAIAIVDGDGALVAALGDVDRPVFPRSAIKLLQALPLVASGAAETLGLSDDELALACASHNGEPAHVQTAAAMLAKAGLDVSALECGTHWPYHDESQHALTAAGQEPTALHNNCSGKHAGFACMGCLMARGRGTSAADFLRGYVQPDHPLMQEVSSAVQAATGCDLGRAPRGIDGCSIPTYGIPLRQLALGFARIATGIGLSADHADAAQRLRRAIAQTPFMVGGSGRFDTRVMQHFGERVCCKVGAEAMYCAALPEQGLGVAIKIDDGSGPRAAEVAMAAVIEAFVPLSAEDAAFIHAFTDVPLRNWRGIDVGRLAAAPALSSWVSRPSR